MDYANLLHNENLLHNDTPPARRVRKIGGSFQHTGTVVSEFKTTRGDTRLVVEFDAPVSGMLHIYRPDQVEDVEPAKPARRRVCLKHSVVHAFGTVMAEFETLEGLPRVVLQFDNDLPNVSYTYPADQVVDL